MSLCARHGTAITVMNGESFSPQEELVRDLTAIITVFSARLHGLRSHKKAEGKSHRPRFKSKKRSQASFYLANDQFELGDHRLWIPKLGWVNMAENLRFHGKVKGARVTRKADWWFVSLQVELPDLEPAPRTCAVGMDVGLNRLATLSTAEEYENQAFLKNEGVKEPRESSPSGSTVALSHHVSAR
jgi:transposase